MAKASSLRRQIAAEAARIMAQQRYLSHAEARKRAASQLGVSDRHHLPDNSEIEAALQAYQALFLAHRQPRALRHLREQAVSAMRMLERFHPRITGDVLHGSADEHSPVQIYLFPESPEEVIFFLLDHKLPWQEGQIRLRYSKGRIEQHPQFNFTAGDTDIELIVLPQSALRNPPLGSLDGRPEKGATLNELRELLDAEAQRSDIGR